MAKKWRFFTPREAVVHEPSPLNAVAIQPGVEEAAVDDDARARFARDGKLHVAAAEPGMRLAQNGISLSHFNLRLPRACPGKCSCFIHKENIERKDCLLASHLFEGGVSMAPRHDTEGGRGWRLHVSEVIEHLDVIWRAVPVHLAGSLRFQGTTTFCAIYI
jgi:hypothetical protein